MTEDHAEQVASFFEAVNALARVTKLVGRLDDLRSELESTVREVEKEMSEAEGQVRNLKSLAGGRPTDFAELLEHLKAHPDLEYRADWRSETEAVRFVAGDRRTLQFSRGEGLSGTRLEWDSISYSHEGFTLHHYRTTRQFTYLSESESPSGNQAS